MSALAGKWEVFIEGFTYEFDISETRLSTNAFSAWRILRGSYSIEGDKLYFKGNSGFVNDRHPRYAEVMRSVGGFLDDLQDEEAVFEYTLSGGELQLRWIDGTVRAPMKLNLSKVHTLKSEKGSSGGGSSSGGCFGVLMTIALLTIGLLSILYTL